jgi:hypothetical protein
MRFALHALLGAALVALGCSSRGEPGAAGSGGAGGESQGPSSSGSSDAVTSSGTGSVGGSYVPSGFSCSGAKPSLANDIVPNVTATNCTRTDGCHLLSAPSSVIEMFVNRMSEECTDGRLMVKPGDPEHSYVINKITDKNLCDGTPSMPRGGGQLPTKDIQAIYDWICTGAPNN